MSVFYKHPLPLPLGEVAEQSEDGEGRPGAKPSQSPSVTALPKGEPRGCTTARKMARISLASPFGRGGRAKRGRRGETRCKTLSVTFGDSSPKGRAKGVYRDTKNGAHLPCLSLWERWTSAARTERGNRGAMPSQSPSATALPKGEPRGVPFISAPPGSWYRSFPASASRPGALPAPTP